MTTCWDLHNIPVAILVDKLDCEIMQFTGLLDKNGKEIYEGDMLDWIDLGNGVATRDFIVYWRSQLGNVGFNISPELALEAEVIGNIHESPELLK